MLLQAIHEKHAHVTKVIFLEILFLPELTLSSLEVMSQIIFWQWPGHHLLGCSLL